MTAKTKTMAPKAKTSRSKTANAKQTSAKPTSAKTRKVTKPKTIKAKATRAKTKTTKKTERRAHWGVALPFLFFAGLACLFWYALQTGDPSRLPSALIGRTVPDFTLPPLEGLKSEDGAAIPSFDARDLAKGQATIEIGRAHV